MIVRQLLPLPSKLPREQLTLSLGRAALGKSFASSLRPLTSIAARHSSNNNSKRETLYRRGYSTSRPLYSPEENKNNTVSAAPKQSMKQRLQALWKQYGVLAVGTYFSIYFGTLGSMFLALDCNLFSSSTFGLDPAVAIDKFCHIYEMITSDSHLPEYIREHPAVGTFGIAYVMTKFTEPVRLGATVAVVPKIARWLGHRREHAAHPENKENKESKQ